MVSSNVSPVNTRIVSCFSLGVSVPHDGMSLDTGTFFGSQKFPVSRSQTSASLSSCRRFQLMAETRSITFAFSLTRTPLHRQIVSVVPRLQTLPLGSDKPAQHKKWCLRVAKPPHDSHAEARSMHRRDDLGRAAHFDLRCSFAPEDVQQELTRRTAESRCGFASLNRHPITDPGPLDLKPATVQPPTQKVAATANVSPQGGIHCRRQVTGTSSIGSPEILVVDKELVQIRHGAHPSDPEEPDGWAGPDPRNQPREVLAPRQCGAAPLGEPLERTG